MDKYKYKNISEEELALPNIGIVKAGEVIETEIEINNKNFELVEDEKKEEPVKDKVEKDLTEDKKS